MAPKKSGHDAALSWLADHEAVRAHCKQFKIEQRLEQGGGIARITGFLPDHVAEACNAMVGGLSTSAWEPMCNEEEDGGSSVIEHNFSFAEPEDHPETLGLLADAVGTPHSQLLGQGMLAPTPSAQMHTSHLAPARWRSSSRRCGPRSASQPTGGATASTLTTTRRT